jgi:adenosylhomocysteine nucleosidase
MIGIIAAMELELTRLTAQMEHRQVQTIASVAYHTGTLDGIPVTVCECGVGKVNAAMHTQILIDRFAPDAIIQNGIAGSLSAQVRYGDTVVGSELVYHDMQDWVVAQFEPLEPVYSADARLVRLAVDAAGQCHVGRIASGDQFISDAATKSDIAARTGALCVEMEGCAVAHTARLNGVPFVVLRAISDMADGSAEVDFAAFQQQAAERAAEITQKLVHAIG